MSDNTALLAGYTRPLVAHNGEVELYLWAKPCADLDGRFKAYDRDACGFVMVDGWACSIEEGED